MKKEETKKICEFGIRPEDARQYKVTRPFYLSIRLGPPVPVDKGKVVYLSKRTGDELFYGGKVEPVALGEVFKVVRPHRSVSKETGEWLDLRSGDIVRLRREEAVELLRRKFVVETEVEDEG